MNTLIQAIVMAGGRGSRLGSLSLDTPKPLQDIAGRPFLDYLLGNLARQGVREVVLSVGYLAGRIMEAMGDGGRLGLNIRYAVEREPLGTGGGAKLAGAQVDTAKPFLLLNGDTLFDFPLWRLVEVLPEAAGAAAMALRRVDDAGRYGAVTLAKDGRISGFEEKNAAGGAGWINGGIYAFQPGTLDRLPKGFSSLEQDLFPLLAKEGGLVGCKGEGFFLDIGLPDTLAAAQELLPSWQKKINAMNIQHYP